MDFRIYSSNNSIDKVKKQEITNFLYRFLEEYGDKKKSIEKAIDYSLSNENGKGGFVLTGEIGGEIIGAVVVNETGMSDYIPENILVYIAVDPEKRGHGYGEKLMEKAVNTAKGDVALHVEESNPAIKLYKKIGFTNPYLEMRYRK
ncbi:MAG: GNAT family N-acetyltransferase [Chlorobiota bacterium]